MENSIKQQSKVLTLDMKQISEMVSVKLATFRKDPEKQLDKLKPYYHVKTLERVHSNSKQFYELTPKSKSVSPFILMETDGDLRMPNSAERQIKLLLQAVLFDGIVPIQKELAKVINMSVRTVQNRMNDMKELGILLPTPTKRVVTEIDPETGEVLSAYDRKDCYRYYYEILPSGNIKRITDTTEIHLAYGRFTNQQIEYLKNIHGTNYNSSQGQGLASDYAKKRIAKDFGFYKVERTDEWTINQEAVDKVFSKQPSL